MSERLRPTRNEIGIARSHVGAWYKAAEIGAILPKDQLVDFASNSLIHLSGKAPHTEWSETLRASLSPELHPIFDSEQKRLEDMRLLQAKRGLFGSLRRYQADLVSAVIAIDEERTIHIDFKALENWQNTPFAEKVTALEGLQVSVKTAATLHTYQPEERIVAGGTEIENTLIEAFTRAIQPIDIGKLPFPLVPPSEKKPSFLEGILNRQPKTSTPVVELSQAENRPQRSLDLNNEPFIYKLWLVKKWRAAYFDIEENGGEWNLLLHKIFSQEFAEIWALPVEPFYQVYKGTKKVINEVTNWIRGLSKKSAPEIIPVPSEPISSELATNT